MQNPQLGRLVIDPEYEVGCIYSEGRRIIEGYLRKMKQGGKKMFGKTTKRWFILNLNRGIFGYKEKEKASVLKGAFDLRDLEYIQEGPSAETKKSDDGFYFGVCFRDRQFQFIAETRQELQMWMQGFTAIRIEMPAKSTLQKIKTNSTTQMPKVKEDQMLQEKHEAAVEEAKVPKEIVKKLSTGKSTKLETPAVKRTDPPTDEEGGFEVEDSDFKKVPQQAPVTKKSGKKKEKIEEDAKEPKRKEIELREELKQLPPEKKKAQAPKPTAQTMKEETKLEEKKPSDKKVDQKAKVEKAEPVKVEEKKETAAPKVKMMSEEVRTITTKTYTTALDQVSNNKNPTVQKVHLEQSQGNLGERIHGTTSAMVVTLKNKQKQKREQIEEIIDDALPSSGEDSEDERVKKEEEERKKRKEIERQKRLLMQQQERDIQKAKLDQEIMEGFGQKKTLVKALNPSVIKKKEKEVEEKQRREAAAFMKQEQQIVEEQPRAGPAKLAMGFLDLVEKKESVKKKITPTKMENAGWGAEKENGKRGEMDGNLSDWDEGESPQKKRKVVRKVEEEFDYDWDDEDDDEIVSPPKKARKAPVQSGQQKKTAIVAMERSESPLEDWD